MLFGIMPMNRVAAQQGNGNIVNASFLNMRSGPGVEYPVIVQLSNGDFITLIGRNAEATWVQIVISTGLQGWVNSNFVTSSIPLSSLPVTFGAVVGNATVNANFLNVRNGPGAEFGIIATLARGEALTLIGRNANSTWIQVVIPNGTTGWVNGSFLFSNISYANLPIAGFSQQVPPAPQPVPIVSGTAFVTANFLNLRSGPAANFDIVTRLNRGQQLNLVGRNADSRWVQVNIPGGASGWVSGRYLSSTVPFNSLPLTSNTGISQGLPDPVPTGGQTGIVTAGNLNVRLSPTAVSRAFTTISQGTGVYLIGRNNISTWLLVQLANGSTGWVNVSFISTTYPIANLPVR